MLRLKTIGWLAAFCLGASAHVAAREEAPQVLTSDLALKQIVESDRLTVNFVFVDNDKIVSITIDGEEQEFEPADTVLITKEFVFTPGRTIITVLAEDEEGNVRERLYLVAYQVELEEEKNFLEEFLGFKINFVAELRVEIDDNPAQDLSLPIESDVGEIQGQIPDSEQTDTRTTVKGLFSMGGGTWAAYAGVVDTSYNQEQYDFIESTAFFVGGRIKTSLLDSFLVNGTLSKVMIGGRDFVTQLTVGPGVEFNTKDEQRIRKHLLLFDVTLKGFDEDSRRDDYEFAFKWSFSSLDAQRQDIFKMSTSTGRRTEGTEETEFNFFRWEGDWLNRWDSGLNWELGGGYEFREYPNEGVIDSRLGDTRLDSIFRASSGIGWKLWKLNLKLNYKYVFNLSNNSPYVRQIYGLVITGNF